ncbi:hypothetical protein HAV21_03410 [Paenarthrobacter sp. MSM-2-10-13]|uniref:hypothetical protein n=1 Tax=Paenarthrobacter sp. MSM-2-10-13 TaxID=2717318 RepID=UPI00142003DD|nr:hypothetical protein [Paenarthrobacter sp. MSM-2-10-13]NHW45945.1 hypothetical protein [Paenarthrobacter sp. MSM-2-10-13]
MSDANSKDAELAKSFDDIGMPVTAQLVRELQGELVNDSLRDFLWNSGMFDKLSHSDHIKLDNFITIYGIQERIDELKPVSFRIKDALAVESGPRAIVRTHLTDEFVDKRIAELTALKDKDTGSA